MRNKDMNKYKNKTLIILSVFLSGIVYAAPTTKNYSINKQDFKLNLPEKWIEEKDFLGTPLTYLAPKEEDKPRAVILIAPMGEQDKNGIIDGVSKSSEKFKKGREEWATEMFADILSFDNYKTEKWEGIDKAHFFGFHYEGADGRFYERTIYVQCAGNQFYYVKSVVPAESESEQNDNVDQTIKSLKCEKKSASVAKN